MPKDGYMHTAEDGVILHAKFASRHNNTDYFQDTLINCRTSLYKLKSPVKRMPLDFFFLNFMQLISVTV